MAWQDSDRKKRLPDNWQSLRLIVLQRALYECQAEDVPGKKCGDLASDVDHIIAGDNHDLDNLQALCSWHHRRKSSYEGYLARMKNKELREQAKRNEHPGMKPKKV